MNNYAEAKEALQKIFRQLERINPSAARSLEGRAGRNAERLYMLENPAVISRGRVAQKGEHLLGQQRVKAKCNSSY
jgi:hypothetical protein